MDTTSQGQPHAVAPEATAPKSPWKVRDFRTLFTATALSELGTCVSQVAVPLAAVLLLEASPGQVGLLGTLSTLAFLLIGLPAGVWVDRMRHRNVLIGADFARALLFASIPAAWALDVLTLEQLYAVVALNGCATVFFDVGSQSMLPQVVGKEALLASNAAIVGLQAAGSVAGRGAGGVLVALITAPLAIVGTAVLYLASALRLLAVRHAPARQRSGAAPRLRTQMSEGLAHVLRHRELRALALSATLTNLGAQPINVLLPVLITRELDLSAAYLGAFWALGGVGVLLGSRLARPVAARLGYGRTLGLAGLCTAPAALLVPLLDRGPWFALAGAGWLLVTLKMGIDNVLGVSLRQRLTPAPLLGRMNATFRFMLTGAIAVGAMLGGLLGEFASLRVALWTGAGILVLAFLPLFLSPVRTRRTLSEQGAE
ncbi:MFS transporter [Streptomyces sp. NPDC021093]|uniref:MFS transporter n=1 Tax=Streptomyces sp. NPDC021093 TaxID=3365112 RepID=UPI0037A3768E